MDRLVEIRTYKLKPSCGARFHDVVAAEAVPLFRDSGTDVVRFGPSLEGPDTYVLIRAYADFDERRTSQGAFFRSPVWAQGSRDWCVEQIEDYLNVTVWLSESAVDALRHD